MNTVNLLRRDGLFFLSTIFFFSLCIFPILPILKACPNGDLSGDCKVDMEDLLTLTQQWLSEKEPFAENAGQVVFEAEHYWQNNAGSGPYELNIWQQMNRTDAVGGKFMKTNDIGNFISSNIINNAPHLGFPVNFRQAGTYYVWFLGRAEDGDSDSIYYGLDDKLISDPSAYPVIRVGDKFTWRSLLSTLERPVINISEPGVHTFDLWMREDGVSIDRILLTTEVDFEPIGEGPGESDGYAALTADLNDDGKINGLDFGILSSNWLVKQPRLVISEFMASNSDTFTTTLQNREISPDWVEIHNTLPDKALSLGGMYLTDDPGMLKKWRFPDGVEIPSGGYLVVCASGQADTDYPVVDAKGYYHTNFKLDSSGDYLALVDTDGTVLYDFGAAYPSQRTDYSYGIYQGQWRFFAKATPGEANGEGFINFVADTQFDHKRGFYDEPFELKVQCATPGAVIRYTLDGTRPTANSGYIYQDKFWEPDGGRIGGAVKLDGQNDFIDITGYKGITGHQSRSVTAWIKTLQAGQIVGWGKKETGKRWSLMLDSTTGALRVAVSGGSITGTSNLLDNKWHHVAVTLADDGSADVSEVKLYVDGAAEEISSVSEQAIDTASSEDVTLGAFGGLQYFSGLLDDVRIYGRALSGVEVARLANLEAVSENSLEGYWPLDETEGYDVADSTGNHNGRLHGSLYIDRTSVVRAAAFKAGWRSSNIETQTYLFLDDVIHQSDKDKPGPGWPNPGSLNGQQIDYGMDQDVVNSPDYGPEVVKDALRSVPTFSIVTDLANLFDSRKGIYVNARQDGREWERPASIELIYPDGTKGFQIDGGIRIRGGYSRQGSNPKHAFRLFFRKEYGTAKLHYPLFGEEGVSEFDNVDLRTSQNYSWSFNNNRHNTMLREVFSRDTQRDMHQPYTRSRYYHLYIDGVYWGLFQTQERSEASYAASYFGGDKSDYDVIKVEAGPYAVNATDGNLDAWNHVLKRTLKGFQSAENYYKIQGLNPDGTRNPNYKVYLDVDNLIDYMICTYYVGDMDGPISNFIGNRRPNNFYGIFDRQGQDGFKFFRHDAEHSLFDGWDRTGPWLSPDLMQLPYFNPQSLHQKLLENSDYLMRFADRVYKYFFNNGVLTPEAARARMEKRKAQIEQAIIAESARWGDAKRHDWERPLTKNDDWIPEVNHILNQYFPGRTQEVLGQLRRHEWYPDFDPPEFSPHGGQVEKGHILALSASNGKIYYTTNGEDPRLRGGNINPHAKILETGEEETVSLINADAAKKVLVPLQASDLADATRAFTVIYIKSQVPVTNFDTANSVLNNPDLQEETVVEQSPVINYLNASLNGHFDNDNPFPGQTLTQNVDNFVVLVYGRINIPQSGPWTFGVNSDDGFYLVLNQNGANQQVSSFVNPRMPSDTLSVFNISNAGIYDFAMLYFEWIGGAEVELFAAPGSYTSFDPGTFRLVGDTKNGGLGVFGSTAWFMPEFNDENWNDYSLVSGGEGAVGFDVKDDEFDYNDYISYNVLNQMQFNNASCFIRIPFEVNDDLSLFDSLQLHIRFDDGFVAYLNGTEIARRNHDNSALPWDAAADTAHNDPTVKTIDITNSLSLLHAGENMLAIQGLNLAAKNKDFLISAELTATRPGDASLIRLNQSTQVKTRLRKGDKWSALNEAVFSVGPVADNLRITEMMYHPADPCSEFIELKNIGSESINLNLVRFSNDIQFTFPAIDLAPSEYILVVQNQAHFEEYYPDFSGKIAGQYEGQLSNSGEQIVLEDALGEVITEFTYNDKWQDITDGEGYSLTIVNETADPCQWNNPRNWNASTLKGGTPGNGDQVIPDKAVVINEILANSAADQTDWIELYNTTADLDINLGGWYLSDDGNNLKKYRIPENTWLNAGQYLVFYQDVQFGRAGDPCGFGLSAEGECVYLSAAYNGQLGGYREQEDFGASLAGVTMGLYQKSTGTYNFVALSEPTPGGPNAYPRVGPVVISEIMYNPPSGNQEEEYIELTNISGEEVILYDAAGEAPWRFTDGIDYIFPGGQSAIVMAAGEKIIVAKNPAVFRQSYPETAGVVVAGPYIGKLNNGGEKLELAQPFIINDYSEPTYIRVDRVNYDDANGWPAAADGKGQSLTRINNHAYGNDPINWQGHNPTPGE